VYPNPTSDLLSISPDIFTKGSQFTASIYDINGKLITSKVITEIDHQISIEAYKTGIYLIKISGNNISDATLIIKK